MAMGLRELLDALGTAGVATVTVDPELRIISCDPPAPHLNTDIRELDMFFFARIRQRETFSLAALRPRMGLVDMPGEQP